MKKIENKLKGFTLVELLIVIAIIGILAGVVTVSMNGAREKANTASAITTMSSLLPELVTCADDGGVGIISGPPTATAIPANNTLVCCATAVCAAAQSGHDNIKWPNINTKTGYAYGTPTNTLSAGTYTFTATKTVGGVTNTITCSYANNECTVATP